MARSALSPQKQAQILQAKQLLRTLWAKSGLKQKEVLEALKQHQVVVKKNTLSNWFSESDLKRPPESALWPLLEILGGDREALPPLYDELAHLLGYQLMPESSEAILNQITRRLNEQMAERLRFHREVLEDDWPALLDLLYEIDEDIFEYDRGFPVIRIELSEQEKLRHLLGKDKQRYDAYRVSEGYEIPLSRLESFDLLTGIINHLHEGVRVLRAYVEKNLLSETPPGEDYPLFEELLKYIWEIVNRLLYNPLCQERKSLKKTLLTVIGTCQGIFYLLDFQQGRDSAVAFQNVLQLKGMHSLAEIHCAVAVYMGVVARQILASARKHQDPAGLKRSWAFFREALQLLERDHQALESERDLYYYKKEIANLCYDWATLLLWFEGEAERAQELMHRAHSYYAQVLETINLFQKGLSEQRATYIRAFYTITDAWCAKQPGPVLGKLNLLSPGETLNEIFWITQVARAVAYGVLHLRFSTETQSAYRTTMQEALFQAQRVSRLETDLEREMEQDFVLHKLAHPPLERI